MANLADQGRLLPTKDFALWALRLPNAALLQLAAVAHCWLVLHCLDHPWSCEDPQSCFASPLPQSQEVADLGA